MSEIVTPGYTTGFIQNPEMPIHSEADIQKYALGVHKDRYQQPPFQWWSSRDRDEAKIATGHWEHLHRVPHTANTFVYVDNIRKDCVKTAKWCGQLQQHGLIILRPSGKVEENQKILGKHNFTEDIFGFALHFEPQAMHVDHQLGCIAIFGVNLRVILKSDQPYRFK